jgi:hypothetical protein
MDVSFQVKIAVLGSKLTSNNESPTAAKSLKQSPQTSSKLG